MRAQKTKQKIKKKNFDTIPFSQENYIIFMIGILVIILGFIFLAQGPADSVSSLTIAPILLVLSYCIIIPISIIYKKKKSTENIEK